MGRIPPARSLPVAGPRHRAATGLVYFALLVSLGGPASAQDLPPYAGPRAAADLPPPATSQAVTAALASLDRAFDAGWSQDYDAGLEALREGEAALTRALEADPYGREAAETLGTIYFYQGYYGETRGFDDAVAFLTRVLEVDPEAVGAGRYLAHTYHHLGRAAEARQYASWVESASLDPELDQEMAEIRRTLDEAFLGGWFEYADFYESEESRVTSFDARTKRVTTELQVTPQLEMQLAAQSLQQLTAEYTPSGDTATRDYLQALVDRLVARSPVDLPFVNTVEVVESNQVNATALPGQIVVHTGLLRFVENEAELVAVLSHELAHIYAHHAARQLVGDTRNRGWVDAAISLTGVREKVGNDLYRLALDKGVEVALDLILRGYQRGHEEEADQYGTHIAFNGGYNPTFMTSFFIRLYEANPDAPFKLLSTHPPYTERIESTATYLESFPLEEELQLNSQEFQEMKARVR